MRRSSNADKCSLLLRGWINTAASDVSVLYTDLETSPHFLIMPAYLNRCWLTAPCSSLSLSVPWIHINSLVTELCRNGWPRSNINEKVSLLPRLPSSNHLMKYSACTREKAGKSHIWERGGGADVGQCFYSSASFEKRQFQTETGFIILSLNPTKTQSLHEFVQWSIPILAFAPTLCSPL